MRVALVGDVHGRLAELAAWLVKAATIHGVEAALQTGDLGFLPRLLGPAVPLERFAVPVHAICGNHEDHRFLAAARGNGLLRRWHEANLIYQPRASVACLGGRTIGFLGGALHVDRPQERPGGNLIAGADVAAALRLFDQERPSVLVTHSCPAGIGIGMRGHPGVAMGVVEHVLMAGFDPGPQDDCGEPELGRLWRDMDSRPALWCFGHFHVGHERTIQGTRFLCRPDLDGRSPLAVLDTGDMSIAWVPA